MIKRMIPILALVALLASVGCAEPVKYTGNKIPACKAKISRLGGLPYSGSGNCAVAIRPFDTGVWYESPLNSHMVRGRNFVQIGCKPITADAGGCVDCTTPGHSNTLMTTFDTTAYDEDITVVKAVLAVYSPDDPQGLHSVYLRGRLNIGDDLQSLGRDRNGVISCDRRSDGWVFYDVSRFVGRAIKERRNAVHFEVSLPCQPASLINVGVGRNEPRLIVEYM